MLKLSQTGTTIGVENDHFEAAIHTEGYVSGVAGGTFVDKKTGTSDHSFGLDIVDFLLDTIEYRVVTHCVLRPSRATAPLLP